MSRMTLYIEPIYANSENNVDVSFVIAAKSARNDWSSFPQHPQTTPTTMCQF